MATQLRRWLHCVQADVQSLIKMIVSPSDLYECIGPINFVSQIGTYKLSEAIPQRFLNGELSTQRLR